MRYGWRHPRSWAGLARAAPTTSSLCIGQAARMHSDVLRTWRSAAQGYKDRRDLVGRLLWPSLAYRGPPPYVRSL